MARRHHVVSAGYQRGWAVGERIQLVDKATKTSKLVGAKDSLVESGFNAIRGPDGDDEQLEREWARVEHIAVPIVRTVAADPTVTHFDADTAMAIKTLMAVHVARSYFRRHLYAGLLAQKKIDPLDDMDVEALRRAFAADEKREPTEGELERLIIDATDDSFSDNVFFIERMVHLHNKVLFEFLEPRHLQVVRSPPGPVEFVTGDTPRAPLCGPRDAGERRDHGCRRHVLPARPTVLRRSLERPD